MSLDKAIAHGKEHRKPYRGSKAIDSHCRNHGDCLYCQRDRLYKFRDKHPPDKTFIGPNSVTFCKGHRCP